MGGKVVEAAVPAHDAAKRGGFEGELADLDRIGAAEFHRELPSENGDEVRLHQNRPRREIGDVGRDKAGALHLD